MPINMNRRGTPEFGVENESSENIKFTGLRPSWDAFWELEASEATAEYREATSTVQSNWTNNTVQSTLVRPASSATTTRSGSGIRNVKFVTGSEWTGEWDNLGMCGVGILKMPHGVIYEGAMKNGQFQGLGYLRYPNGGVLEGFWHQGKLKYNSQYMFKDGLKRESSSGWTYCRTPDRRFYSEKQRGLRAADTEQLSQEDPPWQLPPGQYDTGDGIYSPLTKCVTDRLTGEVLRIPTVAQEEWILKNCRVGTGDGDSRAVGFRPDLYENWYGEESEMASYDFDPRTNSYKELQEYLRQRGCDFGSDPDSVVEAARTTFANLPRFFSSRFTASSVTSKSLEELFMKRFVKDSQRSDKTLDGSYEQFDSEEEAFMMKILNELYSYLSVSKSLSDKKSKTKNVEIQSSNQSGKKCTWCPKSKLFSPVDQKSTSFNRDCNVSTKEVSAEVLENIPDMPRSERLSHTDKVVIKGESCSAEIEQAVHNF